VTADNKRARPIACEIERRHRRKGQAAAAAADVRSVLYWINMFSHLQTYNRNFLLLNASRYMNKI
jgi:hypothetical protein